MSRLGNESLLLLEWMPSLADGVGPSHHTQGENGSCHAAVARACARSLLVAVGLLAAASPASPAVEIDLVLSADLQALVMHDLTLDRTTTCSGPVAERTLADIRDSCHGRVRAERIPKLESVLAWARSNRRRVLLDLKGGSEPWTHEQLASLLATVPAAGMRERVSLLTFFGSVLARAKEVDPAVRTQWILGREWPGAEFLAAKADAVNVDARVLSAGRVRALQARASVLRRRPR